MKNLRKQLIELLNIHGVSSEETNVRNYLKPILANKMDIVKVDDYGNLLAEKKFGNGKGATVLLSAHMDTVKGVLKDRKLIEKNGRISSSVGALGADDRAGIAIILTTLDNMNKIGFNGTVLVAFSREEEIGCKGASKIDTNWYAGIDLAIVVDRRGNRDIVAGCGMAFCSNEVGHFMEDVAKMADMPNWKCTEGGISDAMTFAESGVNSINLSAGYENEHTDKEYVIIADMKDTVKLILQTFAIINQFTDKFGEVPSTNRWATGWSSYGSYDYSAKNSYSQYYENDFSNDIWAEEYDQNGEIFVYEVGKDIVIQQGENEILLSRESLRGLIKQLGNA